MIMDDQLPDRTLPIEEIVAFCRGVDSVHRKLLDSFGDVAVPPSWRFFAASYNVCELSKNNLMSNASISKALEISVPTLHRYGRIIRRGKLLRVAGSNKFLTFKVHPDMVRIIESCITDLGWKGGAADKPNLISSEDLPGLSVPVSEFVMLCRHLEVIRRQIQDAFGHEKTPPNWRFFAGANAIVAMSDHGYQTITNMENTLGASRKSLLRWMKIQGGTTQQKVGRETQIRFVFPPDLVLIIENAIRLLLKKCQ